MANEMTMNALTDCYTLSNGVKIPCVGFGTWQTPDGEIAVSSVLSAIEAGYRHIDTAQGYGNEESVGIAVKRSGVPRGELFITSKLTNSEHGYDKTLAAFEGAMKKLDTDYLDLSLVHCQTQSTLGITGRRRMRKHGKSKSCTTRSNVSGLSESATSDPITSRN